MKEEPTLEEMLRYWRAQNKLTNCHGCPWESRCWSIPAINYLEDEMRHVCPDKGVIEALDTIKDLTDGMGRSTPFYWITDKWWSCDELLDVL